MAHMELTNDIARTIKNLEARGKKIDQVAKDMLEAGADVMIDMLAAEARAKGHVRTSAMVDSIMGRKPTNKGSEWSKIVTFGGVDAKDRAPVRNAEKAYWVNYKTPGDRWVDEAEKAATPIVHQAMLDVFWEAMEAEGYTPRSAGNSGGWKSGSVTGRVG